MLVMLKDGIFEPSSALRHCTELYMHWSLPILNLIPFFVCILMVDQTIAPISYPLIALFRILDLDMLVAATHKSCGTDYVTSEHWLTIRWAYERENAR